MMKPVSGHDVVYESSNQYVLLLYCKWHVYSYVCTWSTSSSYNNTITSGVCIWSMQELP